MNYRLTYQKAIMKFALAVLLAIGINAVSYAQSPTYKEDLAKVAETIQSRASKNNYTYDITYDNVAEAAMFVKPNKSYLVFYVYDISPRTAPTFKAYLMSNDKNVQKKYTAKPVDIGVIGTARVAKLDFATKNFKADKLTVKIEAKPNATIYIYEK